MFQIRSEDRTHDLGFKLINHHALSGERWGSWRQVVAQYRFAGYVDSPLARCCDLVARALGDDFAFELCEAHQNVQGQFAH